MPSLPPRAQENAVPDLFDRVRVVDTDSHLTEPADLWSSYELD